MLSTELNILSLSITQSLTHSLCIKLFIYFRVISDRNRTAIGVQSKTCGLEKKGMYVGVRAKVYIMQHKRKYAYCPSFLIPRLETFENASAFNLKEEEERYRRELIEVRVCVWCVHTCTYMLM